MSYIDPNFVPFDFAAFQMKYKYHILGGFDNTYTNVAKSLPENDWRADLVKARRIEMIRRKEDVTASAETDNEKKIQKAILMLNFAKSTSLDLQGVVSTADAVTIATATNNLIVEISDAITDFNSAGGASDPRKAQFYQDARDTFSRLKAMMVIEAGALLNKNVYFNADLFNGQATLAAALNTLDLYA